METLKEKKPGGYPVPDDQGFGRTCTRFALAKAICAGLNDGIWNGGISIDVDQTWMTSSLCQLFLDTEGKWVSDYHGKVVQIFDKKSRNYFYLQLDISCKQKDRTSGCKFVLVYNAGPIVDLHAVFVKRFENGHFVCMNSHGASDEFPMVDPKKTKGCRLFKIKGELTTKNPTIGNAKLGGFAGFIFKEFMRVIIVVLITLLTLQ